MPFVVVNVGEQQVQELQSSFAGHNVVKHVGECGVAFSRTPADPFRGGQADAYTVDRLSRVFENVWLYAIISLHKRDHGHCLGLLNTSISERCTGRYTASSLRTA